MKRSRDRSRRREEVAVRVWLSRQRLPRRLPLESHMSETLLLPRLIITGRAIVYARGGSLASLSYRQANIEENNDSD